MDALFPFGFVLYLLVGSLSSMAPQIRRSGGDLVHDAKFPPSKRCRVGSERDPPPPPPPPIGKLGNDLLEEILIRSFQNPRCAGRCALVCKRWSALISCPRFNRRFISHHEPPPPQPLLLPSDDPNSVLCFLPLPQKARTKLSVSDCFKDLVLCRFEEESVYAELDRLYLLCNPFTEQWVVLPLAPSRDKGSGRADAKLVCQPRSVCNIELGDGQVFAYSPNYRFRVVCIYQLDMSIRLDVFCSESGEWSQMLMKDRVRLPSYDAVSRDGELFLAYVADQTEYILAAIDPFRLDRSNDGPVLPFLAGFLLRKQGNLSVSQGVLHIVLLETENELLGTRRNALTVWRFGEDRVYWRLYKKVLEESHYETSNCRVLALHPEKPEIVYLEYKGPRGHVMLSCDMTTTAAASAEGGLEYFGEAKTRRCHRWTVFQPKVPCWPTPIPRYDELRSMYDASYRCFVRTSDRAAMHRWWWCVKKKKIHDRGRPVFWE